MTRKLLPPWMYSRKHRTRSGYVSELYYIRFTDWTGARRTFPGGPIFEEARRKGERLLALNTKKEDLTSAEEERTLTLADAVKRFLKIKHGKRSLDKDQRSANRILDFFGETSALNQVNNKIRIEEYKNKRKSEITKFQREPTNATINRELAFLRSVLWLHENSLEENPKVDLYAEDNKRARIATSEEFWAIYKELPKHVREVVIGYWETPMRESELVTDPTKSASGLRWSWIDFKQDVINLPAEATKAEHSRQIPLSAAYKAVLLDIKKRKKVRSISDYVYTVDGQPITRFSVYYYWTEACKAAGVEGLWIHDLRGTWCTSRVRHHDRKFVKAISGHKSDHVFERYVRPTLDDLRAVMASQTTDIQNVLPEKRKTKK